jgi:hypothetical protein
MSELMSVELTRSDLVALRETIELTPGFEGRVQAREAIRGVLRERRPSLLRIDEAVLATVRAGEQIHGDVEPARGERLTKLPGLDSNQQPFG